MNIYKKFTKTFLLLSLLQFIQSCISPGKTARPDKVVSSMTQALAKKYPKTPLIEVKELATSIPYILVDVREQREMAVSMIPGSISAVEFEKSKEKHRGKLIIPYCTIGLRSSKYTDQLIQSGFQAKNLKGGVLSYAHNGLKFIHENKETNKVHVYGEAWNLLPKGYIGIFE